MKQLNEVARMRQLAGINEIRVNNPSLKKIKEVYDLIPDDEDVEDEDAFWAGGKNNMRDMGPNEYDLDIFKYTLKNNDILLNDKEIIILYLKIFENYIGKEYWGSDYINSLIKNYMDNNISILKLL